jgi:fucose permease
MPAAISPRRLAMVGFFAFIALGLTQGVLGVAWPTMRVDFGRPLPDLGNLLAISVGGYFLAGLSAGPLTRRFGTGLLLTATMTLGTASLLLYAVAGSWPILLLASAGVGFSGGLLDSVLNAYVALHHGTRTMNLLHAGFGIGATTGPLLVATALARGLSWRAAYFVLAGVELLLVVTVFMIRRRWPDVPTEAPGAEHTGVGRPLVLGLLALFFLHVGLEVTAGQWSYSLLTQSRGVEEFAAGIWVASYWGGLTGGRLLLGVVGDRIGPRRILRLSMLGTVVGAVVLWWDPAGLGVVGLPIIGFSLAGIFPTLVTLTPSWVGVEKSSSIIGYQVAAASAGSAALPWLVSRLIDARDLEVLGPFLLAIALLMPILYAFVDRHASRKATVRQSDSTGTLPS